jgi:hypothetical protein
MKRETVKTYVHLALAGTALALATLLSENAFGPHASGSLALPAYAAGPQDAPPLNTVQTRLEAGFPAANLRGGPGLAFEIIRTVDDEDTILVTGRTEDYWLQVEVEGQKAWLAGDLVEAYPMVGTQATQAAEADLSLLPEVEANSSATAATVNTHSYSGIGARWEDQDGALVVASVVEGGPAAQAGVQVGDRLQAINDEAVSYPYLGLMDRIRGEAGTSLTLTLFRPETNETLDVTLVRNEINLSTVFWSCADEPIRGFGQAWQNHPETHKLLGCPFTNFRKDEHATRAAVQLFEHGWMLWLETDTVANVDPIYVFFADDGSYIRYGDRPLADAHTYGLTEAGFSKVGDRFTKIYWEEIGEQGRERLGRATNEARDSSGAFQEFEQGRMFWAGESDTIYVIYAGEYDFNDDGQFEWKQGWLGYEDTFEADQP